MDHFRGPKAHDYEALKASLFKYGVEIPLPVNKSIRRIATWSPVLRYEVGRKSVEEASVFLTAAREIRNWAIRSLS
jgi:hypothetical protein